MFVTCGNTWIGEIQTLYVPFKHIRMMEIIFFTYPTVVLLGKVSRRYYNKYTHPAVIGQEGKTRRRTSYNKNAHIQREKNQQNPFCPSTYN